MSVRIDIKLYFVAYFGPLFDLTFIMYIHNMQIIKLYTSTFIHLNRWSSKYEEHIPYTGISLSLWAFELYIMGNFLTQSTGFESIQGLRKYGNSDCYLYLSLTHQTKRWFKGFLREIVIKILITGLDPLRYIIIINIL